MKRIVEIIHNWAFSVVDNRERFDTYTVGKDAVSSIQHLSNYDDYLPCYLVRFQDGGEIRLYNVNRVHIETIEDDGNVNRVHIETVEDDGYAHDLPF